MVQALDDHVIGCVSRQHSNCTFLSNVALIPGIRRPFKLRAMAGPLTTSKRLMSNVGMASNESQSHSNQLASAVDTFRCLLTITRFGCQAQGHLLDDDDASPFATAIDSARRWRSARGTSVAAPVTRTPAPAALHSSSLAASLKDLNAS